MEWLKLLPSIVSVAMFLAQGFMLIIIKVNDFKHLGDQVKTIISTLDRMEEKQKEDSERIAKIEGRCEGYHEKKLK